MENYEIYSILGKGTYAIVYGGIHKTNNKHFALKVFNLNTPTHIVRNEVQVMRHLMTYKIDNVVEVEEIFTNDNGQYVLVMEKLAGGELFDRIIERGSFSERDAAACMKTFIHALHKLHTQVGLIHRDLKPENIVYIDRTRNSDIKIVDFGLSIICNPTNAATGVICKDMVGTIGYMAPESIQRLCYSAESDVWSAGVILYCVLTGIPPFNSEDKHISQRIVHGQYYPMNTTYWDGISEEAKDLVKQMLTVDPMKRITVQGVLNHPWITQHTSISNVNLGAQYIKRIAKLSSRQKFRKVVNGIIWANRLRKSHLWSILSKGTTNNDDITLIKASSKLSSKHPSTINENKSVSQSNQIDPVISDEPKQLQYFTTEQLNLLRQKFVNAAKESAIKKANNNNDQTASSSSDNEDIGYDEFCSIVDSVGLNVLAHPHVFRLFDNDGNGRVDYREFLMSLTAFRDNGEDSLRLCFDIFDADGSGEISLQELKSVMASVMSDAAMDTLVIPYTHRNNTASKDDPIQPPMKVHADDENLTALFHAIDTNGDGFVSFDEFRAWVGNDLSALQAIFIDPMTKALETS